MLSLIDLKDLRKNFHAELRMCADVTMQRSKVHFLYFSERKKWAGALGVFPCHCCAVVVTSSRRDLINVSMSGNEG